MRILNVRINWSNEDDIWEFKLIIPEEVTEENVKEIIIKEHNFLRNEEKEYGSPVILFDYICDKYGWRWEDSTYDIDLNLI